MVVASAYKTQLLRAIDAIDLSLVDRAVSWFEDARDAKRQVFVCGNGGSASTASHFVCDVLKGAASAGGTRFRIIALTDSMATITAYANDVSYEAVFVEQLKNFAERGDLFMAISGSGNSRNVIRAMERHHLAAKLEKQVRLLAHASHARVSPSRARVRIL